MRNSMVKNVLVNGASGRIGRAVTFNLIQLIDQGNSELEFAAMNDPIGIDNIVDNLMAHDNTHGKYDWRVERTTSEMIEIKTNKGHFFIKAYAEKSLDRIPFKEDGIQIVEECSGFFGDDKKEKGKIGARDFLKYGVETVILSYPAKYADKSLVMGVNNNEYDAGKHRIISNASCTTKAIATPLKLMIDCGFDITAY